MKEASNRPMFLIQILVVFIAMVALGWTLGGTKQEEAPEASLAKTSSKSPRINRRAQRVQALATVALIREGATKEDRLRMTIELANSLPVSEFPRWADQAWFDHRDGFELTLFHRIFEERFKNEAPEDYVVWCLEEGHDVPYWASNKTTGAALPILSEWAVHDAEKLTNFFNEYPNDSLEARLIAQLADQYPEVALSRFKEMAKQGRTPIHRIRNAIDKLVQADPEAMEASLIDLPTNLRMEADSKLTKLRLSESFEEEIRNLWDRPDGWALFSRNLGNESVRSKVLGELGNLPVSWKKAISRNPHRLIRYDNAEAWLNADLQNAGFSESQAQRLRNYAQAMLSVE